MLWLPVWEGQHRDESPAFRAVNENSCIDVWCLSDVLIFGAQPDSLPPLMSTAILSQWLRWTSVLQYCQISTAANTNEVDETAAVSIVYYYGDKKNPM